MVKKLIFATICILIVYTASFGQNNNETTFKNILGGRDVSSLSFLELAAIRLALSAPQEPVDSLPEPVSNTLAAEDSLHFLWQGNSGDYRVRYENSFFTTVLPDAFLEKQAFASADYPVKAGDELVLSIWGAVEKQSILKVDNQGKIFIEGIGLLPIAGNTLAQAEKTLKARLQSVYSGISQGRVFIGLRPQGIAPSKVFVFGNVKKPGGYNLPGDANVFLALYRSGGPNDIGSVRNIVIRKTTGDSVVVDLYDLIFNGIRKGESLLRDGDIVFVPKAEKLVSVKGDVPRQAVFELKNSEKIQKALFFAGGLNPTANHTLSVWRIQDGGNSEPFDLGSVKDFAEGKKDAALFFGDTLVVRKSSKPSTKYIKVNGSVWFPGDYQFVDGMGVREAIDFAGGLKEDAYAKRIIVQRFNTDSTYSYLADDSSGSKKIKLEPQDILHIFSITELNYWDKVKLIGAVKKRVEVEWQPNINLKDLIMLGGGFTKRHLAGKIFVERLNRDPAKTVDIIELKINDNLEIENRKELILEPGDRVVVPFDPNYYEQEIIKVTGAVKSPNAYALIKPEETIKEFFERVVELDSKAYIRGAQLFRKKTIVTDNLVSTGRDNYQIALNFETALKGKLKNKDAEILQNGDSIYVPYISPVVFIEGEVTSKGAVLYVEGWTIKDYLNAAGGLTIFGDKDRIVITYADGSKSNADAASRKPDPGSKIFVAYKEPPPPILWTQVVTAFGTVSAGIAALIIAYVSWQRY